jgi:hypothetical protein
MGVWATGLYAGDFALDLRSTIRAVAKLPFDGDRLVDILCQSEREVADQKDDPDHSTFWLVVADQFAKRGIENKRAKEIALEIIDTNSDLAMLQKLGMLPQDLRKRKKVLDELRQSLIVPIARPRPRKVMSKPQPLLLQTGDVLVYPTCGGRCRNPYIVDPDRDRMGTLSVPPRPWQMDSWAAMVIVDSGRAFDFLAWYRPLTVSVAMADKPDMVSLKADDLIWNLRSCGTCSAPHLRRMGIEKIESIAIDRTKLKLHPGTYAAVNDISIANQINVAPFESSILNLGRPYPTINGLMQIDE